MTPGIKPLIAGNWKMNGTVSSLAELAAMTAGNDEAMREKLDMLICVPATLLAASATAALNSGVLIGAQDCHAKASGAHTGDISAEMIADAGGNAVIVGHSERRTDHGEKDDLVKAREQLLETIRTINTEAKQRFTESFKVIREKGNFDHGLLLTPPTATSCADPAHRAGRRLPDRSRAPSP